jgi:hypothetical protein
MVINVKEFAYTTDATLQTDLAAWLAGLQLVGTPARDIRINFITTTRILVMALYGTGLVARSPLPAEGPPTDA